MWSCWALLLVLLGGACALPAPLDYQQALDQAVDSYNQRPEVQNAFRLLSADPEPGPNVQLSSLHNLNFTIMETRCQARSGAQLESCDFKEDGLVKDCAAPVVLQGGRAVLDVTCVDSMADPVRVKRVLPLVIRTVIAGYNLYRAIKRK
ncbi:cathelicidin-1 [Excalfactoria chinensis]|uniref:cathelicidin-1 n=1 Tax=Excalfactoria chinensis TaxID=46218 RepID=UPI003B3AD8FC